MKKALISLMAFLMLFLAFAPSLANAQATPARAVPTPASTAIWKEVYDKETSKIKLVYKGPPVMEFMPFGSLATEVSTAASYDDTGMLSMFDETAADTALWMNMGAGDRKFLFVEKIDVAGKHKMTGIYDFDNSLGGISTTLKYSGVTRVLYDVTAKLAGGAVPALKAVAVNINTQSQVAVATFASQRGTGGVPDPDTTVKKCSSIDKGRIGPVFNSTPEDKVNEQAWLDFIKNSIAGNPPSTGTEAQKTAWKTGMDSLFNPTNGSGISLKNGSMMTRIREADKEAYETYYGPVGTTYPKVPLTNKLAAELNNTFSQIGSIPIEPAKRQTLAATVWKAGASYVKSAISSAVSSATGLPTGGTGTNSCPADSGTSGAATLAGAAVMGPGTNFLAAGALFADALYTKVGNVYDTSRYNAELANAVPPLIKMWLASTYASYNEKYNECAAAQGDSWSVMNPGLLAQAKSLADSASEIGEGSKNCDACAVPSTDNTITGMIKSAFCGVLTALKSWVDYLFNVAVGWMRASLGVTQNKEMVVSDTTTTGSASTSAVPSSPVTMNPAIAVPASAIATAINTQAAANNGTIRTAITPRKNNADVAGSTMPGLLNISGTGSSMSISLASQNALNADNYKDYTEFIILFIAKEGSTDKGYKFSIKRNPDGSFKPGGIMKMSGALPNIPTGEASPDAKTPQQLAVELCNAKKPPVTAQAEWDKGPCLSPNINSSGYAVDVAHPQRTSVDEQNTCSGANKWVELDMGCVVTETHN